MEGVAFMEVKVAICLVKGQLLFADEMGLHQAK
jgi:hypothetical protein